MTHRMSGLIASSDRAHQDDDIAIAMLEADGETFSTMNRSCFRLAPPGSPNTTFKRLDPCSSSIWTCRSSLSCRNCPSGR